MKPSSMHDVINCYSFSFSGWRHFQLGQTAEDRSDASNEATKLGHVQPVRAWSLHGNASLLSYTHTHTHSLCGFTQTPMNEMLLGDLGGGWVIYWKVSQMTKHDGKINFSPLMDTSWLAKASANSCLKETTLRNVHSFLFQFHDTDIFPICLCVCASVQVVSFTKI